MTLPTVINGPSTTEHPAIKKLPSLALSRRRMCADAVQRCNDGQQQQNVRCLAVNQENVLKYSVVQ